MNDDRLNEDIHFQRLSGLDNLEVLHARYTHHSFERHMHSGYAFGVIEDGALGFYYRGQNLVARRGSINLVIPGEVHTGYPLDHQGWRYRMIYLQPSSLGEVLESLGGRPGELPYFPGGVIQDGALAEHLRAMHALLEQAETPLLEKEYWLTQFLTTMVTRHAANHFSNPKWGHEPLAVVAIKQYLEEHATDPVTIEDLCGLTHLTRFHLVRAFSQAVGMPPHAYQRQLRLQRAKALLCAGYSIAAAAAGAGFADQSHLTRCFKHTWGFTPGQYSNNIQYPGA